MTQQVHAQRKRDRLRAARDVIRGTETRPREDT